MFRKYGVKVPSTKFGINLLGRVLGKRFGRRAHDGRLRDDSSSAVQ